MKHPIQKPVLVGDVIRFTENKIVSALLDKLKKTGYTLNELAVEFKGSHPEDYDQLMQLTGYSVSGCPLHDESIGDAAYAMYNADLPEMEARAINAEYTLDRVRKSLKDGVADLYGIHPDDLEES